MTKTTYFKILDKYLAGDASEEEIKLLYAYYNLFDLKDDGLLWLAAEQKNLLQEDIKQHIDLAIAGNGKDEKVKVLSSKIAKLAAAAALFIGLSATLYYSLRTPIDINQVVAKVHDIAPGINKAYLTLADGKRIVLNDAANGRLASQAGIQITKTGDGELMYEMRSKSPISLTPLLNTISTPKGGQYQIRLPDGTKVWLNAASTLKFPATFANMRIRNVELSGEAYFEVAKDKTHPFIVATSKQKVEVLGTHFNLNGYDDEPGTKTTLLEGSVRVVSLNMSKAEILKPGQQSVLSANQQIKIQEVDMNGAIAWKNGYFKFEGEPIQSIMRKISRWYNVEVVYEGPVSTDKFKGTISRYQNISEVLDMLTLTKLVKFKLEGRRVTVM